MMERSSCLLSLSWELVYRFFRERCVRHGIMIGEYYGLWYLLVDGVRFWMMLMLRMDLKIKIDW